MQRLQVLEPDEQHEYLHDFTKILLEKFSNGETEKLIHYLTRNYEFLEAIFMLAVEEDGLSPTRHLLNIYWSTGFDREQFELCYICMAVRNAANVIEEHPEQFASYLYSRLLVFKERFPIIADISPTHSYWIQPLQETNFLQRRSETVTRHENGITHLIISPDSKKVISASSKSIKVYNKEIGYPAIPLISQQGLIQQDGSLKTSHPAHVRGLAITPDSQRLYSVCTLGIVLVWDLNTCLETTSYDLRQQSPEIEQGVTGMTMSGDGRYLYFADGVGSLHEFHTEECVPNGCRVRDSSNGVKQLLYSNQSNTLAALDRDSRIKIWCPAAYQHWNFGAGKRTITSISFSPDGRRLIVVIDGIQIDFVDLPQRRIISTVSNGKTYKAISSAILNADGTRLFFNDVGALVILNTETNDEVSREQIHGLKLINKMVLAINEEQVFTGDERGNVFATETSGQVKKEHLIAHQSFVHGVAINDEGTIGISISDDGDKTWSMDTMQNSTNFSYRDSLKDLAVTKLATNMQMRGSTILSLRHANSSYSPYSTKLSLWDFKTGHTLKFETDFEEEFITAFHADTTFEFVTIATSFFRDQQKECRIYLYGYTRDAYMCYETFRTFSKVTNIAHAPGISEVIVVVDRTQPNGENPGRSLELFDFNQSQSAHCFYESVCGLEHLENTADYETLIATDSDRILIWNISSRLLLHTIETESYIEDMKVSSDGRYIITVDLNKTLTVWSVQTAEKLTSYIHEEDFTCCAVSANGETILTGDISGCVHGFRLKRGKL